MFTIDVRFCSQNRNMSLALKALWVCTWIAVSLCYSGPVRAADGPFFETGAVVKSDGARLYRNAYSTVARLTSGRLLAVFGAYSQDRSSARVVAALSDDGGRNWSNPRQIVDNPGLWDGDPNVIVDGPRTFVYVTTRAVELKTIDKSTVFMVKTDDGGKSWSSPVEISMPKTYVAGKQHKGLRLGDGTLLMGYSWDLWAEKGTPARTEGEMNIAAGALRSTDGIHWTPFGELHVWIPKMTPYSTNGLDEPSIVELADGEILMVMRTGSSRHYESRSRDGGLTWAPPRPSSLAGHNTPTGLWRVDQSEEIIAIWNNSPVNRRPLSVAISADGGRTWSPPRNVAESDGPQVSYPSITQAADGAFVALWQQQLPEGGRDVRWARFNRQWVLRK